MKLNIDKVQELANTLYVPCASSAFGDTGVKALSQLLIGIRRVYERLAPESFTQLYIFVDMELAELLNDIEPAERDFDLQYLQGNVRDGDFLQITQELNVNIWRNQDLDLKAIKVTCLIYEKRNNKEIFHISDAECEVPKLIAGAASMFAIPTFVELSDAMKHYYQKMVRRSQCYLLEDSWYDERRVFFKAKPEKLMRRSLHQFLHGHLRNAAEVRQEQVVDESHPVDIKVSWLHANRHALIEIKWLGRSKKDTGELTKNFTNARAVEGARQLVEYIDSNKDAAPDYSTKGWLVVYDGRRSGTSKGDAPADREAAYQYQDQEITWDIDYAAIRDDFASPVRLYMEPKWD